MHELAYGVTSANPHFGVVRNPWDTERSPGGSSGGSGAAVASLMVYGAMGSDTGGSIRIPAAYCGTVGLKPTYGRVSRYGALPLGYSLDHMGPLTRCVRDAAIFSPTAIMSRDRQDDTSSRRPVVSLFPDAKFALSAECARKLPEVHFERLDPEVELAVRGAIAHAESIGAQVKPVKTPDIGALNAVRASDSALGGLANIMEPHMESRGSFSIGVAGSPLDQGRLIAATDYINAQRIRRKQRAEFDRLWSEVGLHLYPHHAEHSAKNWRQHGSHRWPRRGCATGRHPAGPGHQCTGITCTFDSLRTQWIGSARGAANSRCGFR